MKHHQTVTPHKTYAELISVQQHYATIFIQNKSFADLLYNISDVFSVFLTSCAFGEQVASVCNVLAHDKQHYHCF